MSKRIKVCIDFIPIEEGLPDDFKHCHSIRADGEWCIAERYDDLWEYSGAEVSCPIRDITHWAYIPEVRDV